MLTQQPDVIYYTSRQQQQQQQQQQKGIPRRLYRMNNKHVAINIRKR